MKIQNFKGYMTIVPSYIWRIYSIFYQIFKTNVATYNQNHLTTFVVFIWIWGNSREGLDIGLLISLVFKVLLQCFLIRRLNNTPLDPWGTVSLLIQNFMLFCCYFQRTGGGRAKSGRKGGRSKGSNVFIFPQIPEAYDPLTNKVRVLRDLKG